jgi:hypothetical protein
MLELSNATVDKKVLQLNLDLEDRMYGLGVMCVCWGGWMIIGC